MIDKHEIMLGDWFLYASRPFQVDAISSGGFSVHSDREGWISCADIQPIPLTPEILSQNGFSWDGSGRREMMLATPYNEKGLRFLVYVGLMHKDMSVHAAYPNNADWRKVNKCSLEVCGCYVHELQHAIRFCGIDKKITL